MNCSADTTHSKSPSIWRKVVLPESLDEESLLKVFLLCSQEQLLRFFEAPREGQRGIEVYCESDVDFAAASNRIVQAAADEALRKKIQSKSAKPIQQLVDHVLRKAAGG